MASKIEWTVLLCVFVFFHSVVLLCMQMLMFDVI
jgi:hypothetical protein